MIKTNSGYLMTAIVLTGSVALLSNEVAAKDKDNIELKGYFTLAHDSFDQAFLEEGDGSTSRTDIRRARFSIKSKINDDWQAKIKLGLEDSETEIKDAYIRYSGWDIADITLGKQKEPFGLEKLMRSNDLLMVERSIVTNAFAPGRSIGVAMSGDVSALNWQLGYFQPNEDDSATAVTGRLTYLPWQQGDNLFHLGLAHSERDYDTEDSDTSELNANGNYEFRINEQLEVYYADSLFESDKIYAKNISLTGVELLWQYQGFTALSEWQQQSVKDISNETHEYQGGYVQFSYLFSGENRKYKGSKLGKVTNKGWEVTSRYSQLELLTEEREAQIFSLGLNYHFNKQLKVMANYLNATDTENNTDSTSGNAISLRVQYTF